MGVCEVSSQTFSGRSQGCVGLISSGTSDEASTFLDASADGDDVFFLTSAQLVSQDDDSSYDVYDAHVCSQASPCPASAPASPPPCDTTESCEPAPTPQPGIFGPSGSATFSGAGNLAPTVTPKAVTPKTLTRAQKLAAALQVCRKKAKAKRKGCEAAARKQYGAKKKKAKAKKKKAKAQQETNAKAKKPSRKKGS